MNFSDEFLAMQRILVITPHADDETYGCAGTIARTKALGGEVYVVLASVADFAHYGIEGERAADGDAGRVEQENSHRENATCRVRAR